MIILYLYSEFDNWYAESFLNQSDEPQTSVAAGHGIKPGIFIPYNPNQVCFFTVIPIVWT